MSNFFFLILYFTCVFIPIVVNSYIILTKTQITKNLGNNWELAIIKKKYIPRNAHQQVKGPLQWSESRIKINVQYVRKFTHKTHIFTKV